MASLIGNKPWQVPSNGDLGKLAFMDVVDTVSHNPYYDTAISDVQPTLNLDFVNSKTLDPRITFARSTTASFYDAKSSAKAEENLLLQSQDFDNASWGIFNITRTANTAVSPDGTTTADTLDVTVNGGYLFNSVLIPLSIGTYTASIYFKSSTLTAFNINLITAGAGSGSKCTFNLSAGTAGAVTNYGATTGSTASIVSVGGSWYRCILTVPVATSASYYFYLDSATTGSVFAWGAQLEQRSTVSAYTPTTTTAITNYIPTLQTAAANVARLDYDPITREPKGLLIEESRANLLTYSDDFSNAAWSYTTPNGQITANTLIAPDGTQTADKLYEATAVTGSTVHRRINFTNQGTSLARSVTMYAKRGERKRLYVFIGNGATGTAAWYDLALGTTGMSTDYPSGGTSDITSVGNGWYRCVLNLTALGVITVQPHVVTDNATTGDARVGDGYSGIYIWGAQLEAGSFPTSYIPTVASQVTRSADSASMTGTNFSSWYNQSEGTIYVEKDSSASGNRRYVNFDDGSENNRIQITHANFVFVNGGTTQAVMSATLTGAVKIVGTYKIGSYALSVNGATPVTSSTGSIPVVNTLRLGATATGIENICGYIKKLTYFPKRLPDAELQELTA